MGCSAGAVRGEAVSAPRPVWWIVRDAATGRIVAAGPTGRAALDAGRRLGFASGVVLRRASSFELAVLDIRPDGEVARVACFVCGGSGRLRNGSECRSCGGSGEGSV